MALISDQAFTRHQYHLKMKTSPVPAPSPIRSFQPCSTLLRKLITTRDNTISTPVASREAITCDRRLAFGFRNLRYTSFTRYDAPQLRCVLIVLMYAAANAASSRPLKGEGSTSTMTRTYPSSGLDRDG